MAPLELPHPSVGIITALTKEYAAMKRLLEEPTEIHVPGDGSGRAYVVGIVPSADGGRRLVLLALANKGNNAAAVRASQMLAHFPSVKSIIMTGIAGGVPDTASPERHVRLGDIVISDKKGVVKYDFKMEHAKGEEMRASPLPPSAELLGAVRRLEAGQFEGHYPWEAYISQALAALKWKRPPTTKDILTATQAPNEILAHPKDPDRRAGRPRVFIGPIASSDTLQKNPSRRDILRDYFGAKAVEMEGSGIADATWEHDRGYLVVRGICDYCDGNKGDLWQKYAAVAAAGYTRALLDSLPGDQPEERSSGAGVTVSKIASTTLSETLSLYTSTTYREDQFARLDQAGEADADRTTLLRQVFVDLDLSPRAGQQHLFVKFKTLAAPPKTSRQSDAHVGEGRRMSALQCLLRELWPLVVIIGGPGHGKSTLGQYLAQIHRSIALGEPDPYTQEDDHKTPRSRPAPLKPKKLRLPFRVVLKFYAQWLATRLAAVSPAKPPMTLESYLAEQVCEKTGRDGDVSGRDIQNTIRSRPTLIILDGLDEVTEPELRRSVLIHVEGFLDRAKRMDADMQVLATSRPTEYTGEFDPRAFWHVELQPMRVPRVRSYAEKWVNVKVSSTEDQRRILDTLEDCLKEEHTKLLLTTPLQVTIVLLIIQGGGRPPSLREALFQEFWSTILRREKAKAKGVIRSDDQTLFDLHAYLGYVLHRRAATQDVRSLLPRGEFELAISTFLGGKDRISDKSVTEERARQLVREAAYRLVLLVEPEPGLFGFELRSLQEFFAAVYLAQTARDTRQRFARLKAIGRSPHWGNVALFFAGRIVRMFSGEAANILEMVCRSIDREPQDRFLRRGSWLALSIAADSCFATSRDLQWGAIEFGLQVCETVIPSESQELFSNALGRLPLDDKREILRPLLDSKLPTLPIVTMPPVLGVYNQLFGVTVEGEKAFSALADSTSQEAQLAGLILAIDARYDEKWVVKELERNRNWASDDIAAAMVSSFNAGPDYLQRLLFEWQPSTEQATELICNMTSQSWRSDGVWDHSVNLPQTIKGSVEQIVCAVALVTLITTDILQDGGHISIVSNPPVLHVSGPDVGKARRQQDRCVSLASRVTQLLQLANEETPTALRALLWTVRFLVSEPTVDLASDFLSDLRLVREADLQVALDIVRRLYRRWPLLAFCATTVLDEKREISPAARTFLGAEEQIQIAKEIRAALQSVVKRTASDNIPWLAVRLQLGSVGNIPEITVIAKRLGLHPSEILPTQLLYVSAEHRQYSSEIVQWIFFEIRNAISHRPIAVAKFWPTASVDWAFDKEVAAGGRELISGLLDACERDSGFFSFTITIYLKLLSKDNAMAERMLELLTRLGKAPQETEIDVFYFANAHALSKTHFDNLVNLAQSRDACLALGARRLLATVVETNIFHKRHFSTGDPGEEDWYIGRVPWKIAWKIARTKNTHERHLGIVLLTRSDFPLKEPVQRKALATAIRKAPMEDRAAWADFVASFQSSEGSEDWTAFLQSILIESGRHAYPIVVAVMDRYSELVKTVATDPFAKENALGLSNN